MATRYRKVRRQRGSRTHGWGQITQHRHSGARGGTGMAGLHKHKWSYTVKYAPDHFGHNEFKPPKRLVTKKWLNLNDLARLVSDNSSASPEQTLDLGALGYDKLLGGGRVQTAFNLKVPRASSSAVEKIKSAGGTVMVTLKSRNPAKNGETRENGKGNLASSK